MMLQQIFPFLSWLPQITKSLLRQDAIAGLTGAIIVLPQGVAYAMIAGLPAEYGLYTCIIPAIIAALFGSSKHLISGSTAALSVIVFTTVSQFAAPSSSLYIQLALTLTLCAGVVQLMFGIFRFGAVVNFVSHSVVLGFTAGAAVVISISQVKNLLGIKIESGSTAIENLLLTFNSISETNLQSLIVGSVTIVTCVLLKKYAPKLPNMLLAMAISIFIAVYFNTNGDSIALVGEIPSGLPSPSLPLLDIVSIERMLMGIFAVALLGLVEAISIARSIALKSGQVVDSNQEFVGQGLSNIAGSFFSCYVSSGSFTRSGVNYTSGAQSPLAAIFAAIFLALILIFFSDYAAYIPVAGMAGILFVVAYNLIDFDHIRSIVLTDKKEALIIGATFISALLMHLELSIYVGVLISMVFYLRKTSTPDIDFIDPKEVGIPDEFCSSTEVIRINGSIFFGSVQHIQKIIQNRESRNLIILGRGVNFIDYAGGQMLCNAMNKANRTVYFCRFKPRPIEMLNKGQLQEDFKNVTFYPELSDAIIALK